MTLAEEQQLAEALEDAPGDQAMLDRQAFLELPLGRHDDVPANVYHSKILGVASKGALDRVRRSPAHYRAWIAGYEKKETPALSLGRAIHMAILEPDVFARTYLIEPSFGDVRKTDRTTKEQAKEHKTRREAWRLEHAGATILEAKSAQTTLGMVQAIASDPTAADMLSEGVPEVTIKWVDRETGLVCRLRVDFLVERLGLVLDVKSCEDARDDAFGRSVEAYGYHRQEAHYLDGLHEVGLDVDDFVFLPIEKEPPYAMDFFQLDDEDRATGQQQVRAARRRLAECLARDEWPAYRRPESRETRRVGRPRWARKQDEE